MRSPTILATSTCCIRESIPTTSAGPASTTASAHAAWCLLWVVFFNCPLFFCGKVSSKRAALKLIHILLCSTKETTGWRSLSVLTLRDKTWSWWKIAQISTSASRPVTSPLSTSWRATGCCTNTPTTGGASTSCVQGSTEGTASGEAPVLASALWDVSQRATDL